MSTNIYEYKFCVYVEVDDEQNAWEKMSEVYNMLAKVDIEGDCELVGPRQLSAQEVSEIMSRRPVRTGRLKLS